MSVDHTSRRRGAHSMERIEPNREGAKGWRVFAGDLGQDLGAYRTKADAKDALDTWHYFHPEEQRERDRAWVREFVQSIREANEDGGQVAVEAMLRHYESRYRLDLLDIEGSAA